MFAERKKRKKTSGQAESFVENGKIEIDLASVKEESEKAQASLFKGSRAVCISGEAEPALASPSWTSGRR